VWTLVLTAALLVVLDQATKTLVLRCLAEGQSVPARGAWPIRIRRVSNARPVLGLMRGPGSVIALWAVAVVAVAAMTAGPAASSAIAQACLGSALGGATSNALDRLRRGAVIDLVDIRVWPVFNLADIAIATGVAMALWLLARA
jgi:signal peptidase II